VGSCQGKASDPSVLACTGLHRAGSISGRGILYGILSIVSPVDLTILSYWAFSGFETIEAAPVPTENPIRAFRHSQSLPGSSKQVVAATSSTATRTGVGATR
jgi:hypothetical protein